MHMLAPKGSSSLEPSRLENAGRLRLPCLRVKKWVLRSNSNALLDSIVSW